MGRGWQPGRLLALLHSPPACCIATVPPQPRPACCLLPSLLPPRPASQKGKEKAGSSAQLATALPRLAPTSNPAAALWVVGSTTQARSPPALPPCLLLPLACCQPQPVPCWQVPCPSTGAQCQATPAACPNRGYPPGSSRPPNTHPMSPLPPALLPKERGRPTPFSSSSGPVLLELGLLQQGKGAYQHPQPVSPGPHAACQARRPLCPSAISAFLPARFPLLLLECSASLQAAAEEVRETSSGVNQAKKPPPSPSPVPAPPDKARPGCLRFLSAVHA